MRGTEVKRNLHSRTAVAPLPPSDPLAGVPVGVLCGYHENALPPVVPPADPSTAPRPPFDPRDAKFGPRAYSSAAAAERDVPPPVHSLAVESNQVFGLAGSSTGDVNLFGVRLDEGQIRHQLRPGPDGHDAGSAIDALALLGRDTAVLSGGADRKIVHWDLNVGRIVRRYTGSASPITTIQLRPTSAPSRPTTPAPPAPVVDAMDVDPPPDDGPFRVRFDPANPVVSNGLYADTLSDKDAASSESEPEPDTAPPQLSDDVFLTRSANGKALVWDRRAAKVAWRLRTDKDAPSWGTNASWSQDGERIYLGMRNSAIQIHDVRTGTMRVVQLPEWLGAVYDVAPMPDGRFLLVACFSNLGSSSPSDCADWTVLYDLEYESLDEATRPAVPFRVVIGYNSSAVAKLHLTADATLALVAFNVGDVDGEGKPLVSANDGVLVHRIAPLLS